MKSLSLLAAACGALVLACASPAGAIVIDATFDANFTPDREACAQAAIDQWDATITNSYTFSNVRLLIMDLSFLGNPLAATNISSGAYQPLGAQDEGIRGTGWESFGTPLVPWGTDTYITIALNTTYVNQMYFGLAEAVPGGEYDALTILRHELCHAVGFAEEYAALGTKLTPGPGSDRTYNGNGFTVEMTPASNGTHLVGYSNDLMNATLGTGVRRDISDAPDLRILMDAYGYTTPEPATLVMLTIGGLVAIRRRRAA